MLKSRRLSLFLGLLVAGICTYFVLPDFLHYWPHSSQKIQEKQEALDRHTENLFGATETNISVGIARTAKARGLPEGMKVPTVFDSWETDTGSFQEFDDLPIDLRKAITDILVNHVGDEVYRELEFVGAISIDPPASDLQIGDDRTTPPRPVAHIATFVARNPVAGVRIYEGIVALDAALTPVEIEFPYIESGSFEENLLSVKDVIAEASKRSFFLLTLGGARATFSEGKILVSLATLPTLDTKSKHLSEFKFALADFDLQTAQMVGAPEARIGLFHDRPVKIRY